LYLRTKELNSNWENHCKQLQTLQNLFSHFFVATKIHQNHLQNHSRNWKLLCHTVPEVAAANITPDLLSELHLAANQIFFTYVPSFSQFSELSVGKAICLILDRRVYSQGDQVCQSGQISQEM
jgi:hypothetical protein